MTQSPAARGELEHDLVRWIVRNRCGRSSVSSGPTLAIHDETGYLEGQVPEYQGRLTERPFLP